MEHRTLFDKTKEAKTKMTVITSDIKLTEQDYHKVLMVSNYPIFSYPTSDKASERYLIVQLNRNHLATQKKLARAFGVNLKTIKNYKRRFQQQGLGGLLPKRPSLSGPRKITAQVVRTVLTYYFTHTTTSENEIAKQVSAIMEFSISQPAVGRILEQCGFKVCGEKPLTEPFKGIKDEHQLEFNFTPLRIKAEPDKPKETPQHHTQADQFYIQRLKKGLFSSYGAAFLYTPFLLRFHLLDPFLTIYGKRKNKYISATQVWLTFFHMIILGFPSIESLKTAHADEFGPLLGRNYLPSVKSLREFLTNFSTREKSETLIFLLCQKFLECQFASLGVLYIDGHFLPYFGFQPTLKSWYNIRRLCIKGNNQYFANDREQNPLFFLIRPPSVDLIRAIEEMILSIRKFTEKPLTLIFDRGGFSQEFFIKLRDDQRYPDVTFITWAEETSFSIGEVIQKIDENSFKLSLVRLKTKKVKIKLVDTENPIGTYGMMRMIVLLIPESKKRIAILTSDARDKKEIASLMINRWGQENFFKLMKKKYYLDYHPGYDTKEIEDAPMIKNPEYDKASKTIKKINTMIAKASAQLGKKTQQSKVKNQTLARLQQKHQKLVRKIRSLHNEKKRWLKERRALPKKISLKEAYLAQNLRELDLEKKAILDAVKITVYNLQRHLMQWILRTMKPKNKKTSIPAYDIIKQITGRGAELKLRYNVLHVTIGYFNDKQVQKTAKKLCEYLNTLNQITLDKFRFNIRYHVQSPRGKILC